MNKPKEPKLYDLTIEFTGGNPYPNIDIEANLKTKEALESIPDFKKRLSYFNQNICSLSVYKMQPEIYYQWGSNPDQRILIFSGCQKCRNEPDFNLKHEKIYLSLRDKEVKRLVDGIKNATTYKDKIEYLFAVKGYGRANKLTVHANAPYSTSKDANVEMFLTEPVIDLNPNETDEIITYNGWVKTAFDNKFRKGVKFSEEYDCFDYQKESQRLNHTLMKSIAPLQLLEYCKSDIENYFHYDVDKFSKNKIVTRHSRIEDTLFAKMVFGVSIDLNETKLNNHILFRYYHISEVVKFYRFIIVKIRAIMDPEKEAELIRKSQPPEIKIEYTIADQMEKELNIIYTIFTSQYAKFDRKEKFPYILNEEGNTGIDGRYINRFDIVSNVGLMSTLQYKKHFTERYESTNNPSLVQNQLFRLRKMAIDARDYYNEKLTGKNEIVQEFADKKSELDSAYSKLNFEKSLELSKYHSAVILLADYHLQYIYLGCDKLNCKHSIMGDFWYTLSNYELANYCHNIVEFADMFKLESSPPPQQTGRIKTKLDFTPEELEQAVLKLTKLYGYEKPSEYLDELLKDVKQLNDLNFEDNFFLNIHNICKKHSDKFWSESHRKDITEWLDKSRIVMFPSGNKEKEGFDTWDKTISNQKSVLPENKTKEPKISIPTYALMHVYLAMFQGQAVTQQNKTELAIKYGYTSGEQLRNDFTFYQNEDKRMDINLKNKRSAQTHLNRFELILPLLKKQNLLAFQKAKEDFEVLKKEYNKHY